MVTEIIGFCGLECHKCPAFLATQADDNKQRVEIAKNWSKEFNADIKPDNINCDGCKSDTGRLIGHCHVCEIRKCGVEKRVENCGYCNDFPCKKLDFIFDGVPDARERLEDIKRLIS